jgi:hypothetical protein
MSAFARLSFGQIWTHLGIIGGRDDQVQRPGVRGEILLPTRVGGDKLGSAELHGILLLPLRVRDGSDVGTQGLGEQQSKVSETSDSDDTDVDTGTGAVGDERVVNGHTSTEHRRGKGRVETVGDLDDKVTGRSVVGSVASVTLGVLSRALLLELSTVGSLCDMKREC